ncbi:metallophosphoesterase family protein [Pararhodobacter oceanensis]|uniref:metallophosphoesterase family protein n=1 Tax=Pararhodobacter oceanensis TaxID=2172121 RepID=UPI003A9018D3
MSDTFRLLHSADLHLGRRFGTMPEAIRGRLIEARHQIVQRLADTARAQGAADILLAGDTFDTQTPSAPVWRQALAVMAADPALRWWILPGNHDSLQAETLWAAFIAQAPENVTVITNSEPLSLRADVTLLPSPLQRRRPSSDPTAWMDSATTEPGVIRLGLAHGSVTDFSAEGSADDGVIAPDRAQKAGLAYLALGDWHGHLKVGNRTAYSGTPEADGFTHSGRGGCLIVTLQAGMEPQIDRFETGLFHWSEAELPLLPGQDPAAALNALIPDTPASRRDHLLRIRATGRTQLLQHQALTTATEDITPDFAYFQLEASALQTEVEAADLELLDHGGALRIAAEALSAQANDAALPEGERRIATGALNRLYGYLRDGS